METSEWKEVIEVRKLAIALVIAAAIIPTTADAMIWRCFTSYDWWGREITNCRWVCDPIEYDAYGTCN